MKGEKKEEKMNVKELKRKMNVKELIKINKYWEIQKRISINVNE